MYYNRIFQIWVLDPWDYFLISAFIGSLIAPPLKNYLSEKAAMERLKNSIIKKSNLRKSKRSILNYKQERIKKIYKFVLGNRGGQFEEFQADYEFSNKVFNLAQEIKGIIERLAVFLKQRELKGIVKIFFKGGRLILQLVLYQCNINISYLLSTEGLSTQIIVLTATTGGAAGFTLSWFSACATLVSPPILASVLILRSFTQQFLHQREYSDFKKLVAKMLDEGDLKETIQAFFMQYETPTLSSSGLKISPSDLDQNPLLKHDFSSKSGEDLEEFIKNQMKEDFGLIENPTETQLEEIIRERIKRKPKGKSVYFRDLVAKSDDYNLLDSGIKDAEIIEEAIRVKSDNEF